MRVALATASRGTPRSSRARFSVSPKALISTKRQLPGGDAVGALGPELRFYIITPVRPNVVGFTPSIQNLTRRILRRIDARASLLLRPCIRAPRGFSRGLQGEHLPVPWISPRDSPRGLQPQLRPTTAKEGLGEAASRETASRELKHPSGFLTRLHD